VGVDQGAGVLDVATQTEGVAASGFQMRARSLLNTPGQAEVAFAVRHLRELDKGLTGAAQRLVDVPERTGAAKPGELEAGGAVALGDVPGPVDPQEIEGDAPGARSLQGAEPVAGLLETGLELQGQAV